MDRKYIITAAVGTLILLLPFPDKLTFLYFAGSLLIFAISFLNQKPETKEDKFIFILSFLTCLMYLLLNSRPEAYRTGFGLALLFYLTKNNKRIIESLLTGFLFFFIITFWYSENMWNFMPVVLTIASLSSLSYIINVTFGNKAAVIMLPLSSVFRIATAISLQYRYSYLTLSYIASLKTALNVAPEYALKFGRADFTTLRIAGIITILWIIFIKNQKREPKKAAFSFIAFTGLSLVLVTNAGKYINSDRSIHYNNFYEGFMLSVADEIKTSFIFYDEDSERELVSQYESDEESDLKPNIVGILCESYADVCDAFGVTPSGDPMKKYKELEEKGCKLGYVNVDTIGGGTANSEWEFLTGLDISKLSKLQTPFTDKCKVNYTFSADPMYEDYNKVVMHPYKGNGHNRLNVYEAFEYDEMHFLEDTEFFKDYDLIRNLVTDKSLYKKIEEQLRSDKPQFVTAITMQNHGDYLDLELDNKIKVDDNYPEKERLENYLTLIEHSSEDLYDFITYLEEHPEEPTLVVFFGDHFPGRIAKDDDPDFYKTPYLVYSNFSDLTEMPEETDLSQLYPYAKKSAGLPLSAYEKYLISLNGETPDKKFIKCRIDKGYF